MKKLTAQIKKIWGRITHQFKKHPVRSVSVTVPAVALITLGILFFCGVFNTSSGSWDYLPNRAYILAPTETAEPQTLYELLHSDNPGVDTLLRNPSIADEIINAESLIDIIDSRFALNNLRELDRQIHERLTESPEDIYLLDLPADAMLPLSNRLGYTPFSVMPLANTQFLLKSNALTATAAIIEQSATLSKVSGAMERLLIPSYFGDTIQLSPAISMKGIWQNGEALLHLTPSADWLPDDGYELYRTVNGESVLVESGIAAPSKILSGEITIMMPYTDEDGNQREGSMKDIYEYAALSDAKLGILDMTAQQFNQTYYVTDTLEEKTRIPGAVDFNKMRNMQITIPGMIEQKIPDTDFFTDSPIYVMDKQPNGVYTSAAIQLSVFEKFSVKQTNVLARSDVMLSPSANGSAISENDLKKRELVRDVLDARRQITTLSYADADFAEEAKFLIHDDLTALGLPDGTVITYTAQNPDGSVSATLEITIGVEFKLSQPTGLDGFGIDGRVPLRWDEAASQEELNIIIGYNIERKLDGENGFTKINDVPVAISHMLDDTDLYLESVVFYEDEVENGRGVQYRVCSLDIFGRAGEYSEVLIINKDSTQKVEKVTPPNAPSISAPALSTDKTSEKTAAVQASIDQNAGKKGVVLPIFTESSDTARFTVYRAVAVGAGGFGAPEVLANVMYDNPIPKDTGVYTEEAGNSNKTKNTASANKNLYKATVLPSYSYEISSGKGIKQILPSIYAPLEPSLVFFDADIQDGCTYKYWVSAWDDPEWNNESAWSDSVTIGVSTEAQPKTPNTLNIKMLSKKLPDFSLLPPGIVIDTKMTAQTLAQPMFQNLPMREYSDDVDTETVAAAETAGVSIGKFISGTNEVALAPVVSLTYNNLPENRYIHMLAAIRGEDVKPNGTAYLKWPAYSGGGLKGYVVYKPAYSVAPPELDIMQTMTRKELVEMCEWRKVSGEITQNQVLVSGLDNTPGSINLFLVCLAPEHNFESSKYVLSQSLRDTGSTELVEPVKPKEPKAPTLSSLNLDVSGTVKVDTQGTVWIKVWGDAIGTRERPVYTGYVFEDASNVAQYTMNCLDHSALIYFTGIGSMWGESISTGTIWYEVFYAYYEAYRAEYRIYDEYRVFYPELLADYEEDLAKYEEAAYLALISGHVEIKWDKPDDPQIKYYRIYRAEVDRWDYKNNRVNEQALEWTMVGDNVTAAQFTDPVEQSIAHYYYYKVTAVSAWGVESEIGAVNNFRVPATVPPATPNMQLPLSSKNGVKVNFSSVSNCNKYILYRTEITRLTEKQIEALKAGNEVIFDVLFQPISKKDTFMSKTMRDSLSRTNGLFVPQSTNGLSPELPYILLNSAQPNPLTAVQYSEISAINKFKTISQISRTTLRDGLSAVSNNSLLNFTKSLVDKYGPLILADYCDLSYEMMNMVGWEVAGVLNVDENTKESDEGNNVGLLKPLFIEDAKAKYGHRYLYTVRAWNDDNLGSTASEPVEGTPRRNGPFDRIDGIEGTIVNAHPSITWNPPHMKSAGLTVEECKEDTVGYIVYRADNKDGPYYQASPLLFNTNWTDTEADIFANNWYNVKVLDTGGYFSEFSKEPVLVQLQFYTNIKPFIPIFTDDPEAEPPLVNIPAGPYTVKQGDKLVVPFTVTGDEPITYSITGSSRAGEAITGIAVDGSAKTITIPIPDTLTAGSYAVTLTAENAAGEGRATFNFTVEALVTSPKIEISGSRFSTQQGTAFQTAYTLTGTEPITVTVEAKDTIGDVVSGFTVNTVSHEVAANDSVAAGTYTVTVTAQNSAGESSATFTLEVTAKVIAPVITIKDSRYTIQQGTTLQVPYTLTGTEPITVTVTAKNARGSTVSGFTVNTSSREIVANDRLAAGTYTVTVTAKNSTGESSATFTLEVTAKVIAPVISFNSVRFTIQQGTTLQVPYTLTGTEPITVTVAAKNARGSTVSGFTVNTSSREIVANERVAAGTYTVTVTAKNSAGESSATFTLEVTAKVIAPVISFNSVRFTMQQGTAFQTAYTLTGTEPITVTVAAKNANGGAVSGFTVNTSSREVVANDSVAAGTYTVTVTAQNSAGESSATFTLEVTATVTAPVISFNSVRFTMQQGTTLQVPYTLTGTEPITVTVAAKNARGSTVSGFTVNTATREVAANDMVAAGTYTVTVTAKNNAGESSATFTLEVTVKATAPVITIKDSRYTMQQGTTLQVPYTLTGTEPITVTVAAKNANGGAVSGFTVNTSSREVTANDRVAAGTYTVTVTAKNSAGESSATFTLDVTAKVIAPVITIKDSRYTIQQGTTLQVPYTLTGTEPITVTVAAKNANGGAVSGFTVNTSSREVVANDRVAAGTYTVTVTAKNNAGESSATFTLEVTAKVIAPVITIKDSQYTMQQGTTLQVPYTLTGTEPITVTVAAKNANGGAVSGFTVNTSSREVAANDRVAAGTYTVTVTAKNSAGESSATFTLEVTVARTAPVIAEEKHGYTFEITAGGQTLNVPVSATGSEPIIWSLEASEKMQLPSFLNIDAATGILTTTARATQGTYYFVIKATNDVGSDTKQCTLYVREAKTAPAFVHERHNYEFSVASTRREPTEIQINVTGSAPIKYSLEQYKDAIPQGVSIDSDTGVLKIGTIIKEGSYYFTIKAENDAGSDTQLCLLTVRRIRAQSSSDADGMEITLLANQSRLPQIEETKSNLPRTVHYEGSGFIWVNGMRLTDYELTAPALQVKGTPTYYSGTALLEIGIDTLVPVNIQNAVIKNTGEHSNENDMVSGIVYMETPFTIEENGVTLVSLMLRSTTISLSMSHLSDEITFISRVSGYVKSNIEGQNLLGNVGYLMFEDATLSYNHIDIYNNLPAKVRYEQFTFNNPTRVRINTSLRYFDEELWDASSDWNFIELWCPQVLLKSPMETLDNQDIVLDSKGAVIGHDEITFNFQGKIREAVFILNSPQSLQMLVPGGSMLRIDNAVLKYHLGEVTMGTLNGRLILPFEQTKYINDAVRAEGVYAKPVHPDKGLLDAMIFTGIFDALGLSDNEIEEMYGSIIHFGETVQSQGLLIVPRDTALQDKCSYVTINITDWAGAGFVIDNAPMTETNVADRSLAMDVQSKQGFNVVPTAGVTVDLDRIRATNKKGAPTECAKDFWVGIIINKGTLTLPEGFVKTRPDANGKQNPIVFNLAPGEMIYDLNGFNYQTYLYAPNKNGVEASVGDELGGFPNAWIHDVMVDMYNNKIDFEVNMTVAVDFLMGNRVNAKLYTLKEPEEINGEIKQEGTFLCSVAPTLLTDAIAQGFDMRIDGGFFEPDGMRIHGALLLPGLESDFDVRSDDPLAFTDMIIPADRHKTADSQKYGYATLDTPVNIDFNGYTIQTRVIDLEYDRNNQISVTRVQGVMVGRNIITLNGATVLADNIPLSSENSDSIVISAQRNASVIITAVKPLLTKVEYKDCKAVLNNTFDECFTVSSILTSNAPKSGGVAPQSSSGYTGSGVSNLLYTDISGGGGQYTTLAGGSAQNNERFTEYEADDIAFGFIDALELIPFETAVRFGHDNELGRNYFAIGLAYTGMPIEFGFGQIRDIGGVVSYNMNVDRDPNEHNRFKFPKSPKLENIKSYIANLTPYEGNNTKFAAGFYATMNVEHLCEIRGMYFAFESGPIIEAGGDLYVPLEPSAILGGDPYTKVGTCVIMYNHPARNFSINIDIDTKAVGVEIYGNINMQWNPKLFGIYIGYPEMLTAKVPGFKAGAGFAFQTGKEDSFIAAKMRLDWSHEANLGIVYLGGYIEGGVVGEYHFAGDRKGDLTLELWLKGGIKGGIWFFGKRDIINFYLGAEGKLTRTAGGNKWNLYASCDVRYSVSLFIASIHGSAHCSFDTSF